MGKRHYKMVCTACIWGLSGQYCHCGVEQNWIIEVLMTRMILSKILDVDTTLDYSLGTYSLYWHKFGPSNEKKKST